MSRLAHRLLLIHDSLAAAGVRHAFGGAIALAYCTREPRGTRDLDVNVFVDPAAVADVAAALPDLAWDDAALDAVRRDGQVRVYWDDTPVDLFFDVHDFHRDVARDVRWVPFEGRRIPVISCAAVIVFKALFNRTRDWGDIETVIDDGVAGPAQALAWLRELLGPHAEPTRRLARLLGEA